MGDTGIQTGACGNYHRDSIGGICFACGRPRNEHPVAGNAADVVREVLQHHRLEPGTGYSAGEIICIGCHHVLGDATQHLVNAVEQALNPHSEPSQPRTGTQRDPRESAIGFEKETA